MAVLIRILAIDPGPLRSGWVILSAGRVEQSCAAGDNLDLLGALADMRADVLAIERVAAMGQAVGQETIDTERWVGRYQQQWYAPEDVRLVYRRQVRGYLCGTQSGVGDAHIRRALLDIFPPSGGGATPQVGTRSRPGPLYGVSSHAWQALAVAVTVAAADPRLRGALPPMPEQYR